MVQAELSTEFNIKTFNIKSKNKLSSTTQMIMQSFKMKLYYYVVDDLLYLLRSNQNELNDILQILNSTVLFLQNNLYIDFFDIYIYDITINEVSKFNKFINNESNSLVISDNINIKLAYKTKSDMKI